MRSNRILIFITIAASCMVLLSGGSASSQTPGQGGLSISGYVWDDQSNGIPGAVVTLYNGNMIGNQFVNSNIANIPNNPQTTSNTPAKGMYLFTNVTKGFYNLTVEKDGYLNWQTIQVDEGLGTLSQNIVLKGYGEKPSATAKPPATARPTANQVIPINVEQPSDLPSFYDIARILAITAVGAQLVFCLVVLALFTNTKK